MSVYMLTYPRPTGTAPVIYYKRPKVTPEIVEVEPGYFLEDPYTSPEIEEFNNELEARKFYKKFYPDSYSELRVEL